MSLDAKVQLKKIKNRQSLLDEAGGEGYAPPPEVKSVTEDPKEPAKSRKKGILWDVVHIMRTWGKK